MLGLGFGLGLLKLASSFHDQMTFHFSFSEDYILVKDWFGLVWRIMIGISVS